MFGSGFFQIAVYDYYHQDKELKFLENYSGPVVWWPTWTLLAYFCVIAKRTGWFEKIVDGLLADRQRIRERGFLAELKYEFSGLRMPKKKDLPE